MQPTHLEFTEVRGQSALGEIGDGHAINFRLGPGDVGVVFGGKDTSSLFRLIMGQGRIKSGEITLLGDQILDARPPSAAFLNIWRQRIGFGFREKGLISNLSILDNVDLPARYHGYYKRGVPIRSYAEHALAETGIDPRLWSYRPTSINWEIRKKVLLARAIVLRPKMIILDDPSALIASPSMPELLRWILRQKAKGTAILCGTNDYPFGLAIADWVLNPRTNEPTKDYQSFIDEAWIGSAALLRSTVKVVARSA